MATSNVWWVNCGRGMDQNRIIEARHRIAIRPRQSGGANLIMVIVKMFQKGETGMGIACVVLSVCTGIGALIAFVYGWIKSSEWGLKAVMITWTLCFVLNMLLGIAAVASGALVIPANVEARPQVRDF